jgi:hypothetical protein
MLRASWPAQTKTRPAAMEASVAAAAAWPRTS